MSDELAKALREGAEPVAEGRVRVDAGRALERLRKYRLSEPSHWVLEVVRAAVASGADEVHVRTDADDVEVRFAGNAFPEKAMKELLEQALNDGKSADQRRAKLLGLGVAGALGVEPRFVKVTSGGVHLELAPPSAVQITKVSQRTTHVHVRKRLGVRVALSLVTGAPEAQALFERGRRFPGALVVNGEKVSTGDPFHRRLSRGITETIARRGTLVAGLPEGPPLTESVLELDVLGIHVGTRTLKLPGLQLLAALRGDDMQRNVSGSDVVDTESLVGHAIQRLEALSLELLAWETKTLAETGELPARAVLRELLTAPGLHPKARDLLAEAPLLPGPGGEWVRLSALEAEARQGRPIHIAFESFPRGSYPEPAVLWESGAAWRELIRKHLRQDVAELVARRRRAAEARADWERLPREEAHLPEGSWLARAPVKAGGLEGEVGVGATSGAGVVRLLSGGRLLQVGEVPLLAPLVLKAVVNLEGPIPDRAWESLPSEELWKKVAGPIAAAAEQAVLSIVGTPESVGAGRLLLLRLVRTGTKRVQDLPQGLRDAKLFDVLGGGQCSLSELAKEPTWRWTESARGEPLLSNEPVLVLRRDELEALQSLGKDRLSHAGALLEAERQLRRRLAGPKVPARVPDAIIRVPVAAPGVTGEVAIAPSEGKRGDLTLLRQGFVLEVLVIAARYGGFSACVDSPTLVPTADWDGARRDAEYDKVIDAVRAAEPALAVAIAEAGRLADLPLETRRYLVAFARKELAQLGAAALSEHARRVASAPLLEGLNGRLSVLDVATLAGPSKRVYVSSGSSPPQLPAGVWAVEDCAGLEELLREALGFALEPLQPHLARLETLRRFEAEPEGDASLPEGAVLSVAVSETPRVHAALGSAGWTSRVRVFCRRRQLLDVFVESRLPLELVIEDDGLDVTKPGLWPPTLEAVLDEARARDWLRKAETALLTATLDGAGVDAASMRACRFALGASLTSPFPKALWQRLAKVKAYPCTDGVARSASELSAPVRFVTRTVPGASSGGGPVVRAIDAEVRTALRCWRDTVDVTESLERERAARSEREKRPAVERVAYAGDALIRRPVTRPGLEGELVVARYGGGGIAVFHERRLLCTVASALPEPLAAAINCDALTPTAAYTSFARDSTWDRITQTLHELADELGDSLGTVPTEWLERSELRAVLGRLCLVLFARRTGKKRRHRTALEQLPIFEATGGRRASLAELIDLAGMEPIGTTREPGDVLDPARWLWCLRPGEAALAKDAGLRLEDRTAEVRRAAELKTRLRLERLEAPVFGTWREPLAGAVVRGEVALGDAPTRELVIDVVRDGLKLERFKTPHPVGGFACLESNALTPDALHRGALRDGAWRTLLDACEGALERLVVGRLSAEPRGHEWLSWVKAAVTWRAGQAGPLGELLPALALFADLQGRPITVGAVLAEISSKRRVAVAEKDAGTPPPDRLVLEATRATLELLDELGAEIDDLTESLERARALEASREARRVRAFTVPGKALVRAPLAAEGVRGEATLDAEPGAPSLVRLVKEGIEVGTAEGVAPEGLSALVELDGLPVDDDWTSPRLTSALRSRLKQALEAPFVELAAQVAVLGPKERLLARLHVLRLVEFLGANRAEHLDRLTGAARELLDASLFPTVGGRWLSLRSVAGEIVRKGSVAIIARRLVRPDVGGALVLEAEALDDAWLDALAAAVGTSAVNRVTDVGALLTELSEEDPERGTPERAGLWALRKELRLLRPGALGKLTDDELVDVRLKRAGGATPISYDRKRRLVLLDPESPAIARALRESTQHPERTWVLLASVFGAVNRALDKVTDAHEAQLLLALAAHLAANPRLLEPHRSP